MTVICYIEVIFKAGLTVSNLVRTAHFLVQPPSPGTLSQMHNKTKSLGITKQKGLNRKTNIC